VPVLQMLIAEKFRFIDYVAGGGDQKLPAGNEHG
jgi:hypothetical protein